MNPKKYNQASKMIVQSNDVNKAILSRVYPELLYDSDPDIEKYFDLRKDGRSAEALSIYNNRLARKYPDLGRRKQLLMYYRTKNPAYVTLHRQFADELAKTYVARIKRVIVALTMPLHGVNMRDTFLALKAIEEVVHYLPSDKYEAINLLANYTSLAKILDFHSKEMEYCATLTREYLFESNQDEEADGVDFMERSRRMEAERRAKVKRGLFDLSRINFGSEDVKRITLPAHITRKEDKVIGYCYKYWTLVNDQSFERLVLLYSRKYRTPHYDIYRAIKVGRLRRFTDDEILNTVSTVISSSYSYSVQGDIYMQSMWRRLKASLSPKPGFSLPAQLALPAPKEEPARAVAAPEAPAPEVHPVSVPSKSAGPQTPRETAAREKDVKADKPVKEEKQTRRGRPKKYAALQPASQPKTQQPTTGSVSDIVKRISGRTYDVYHDIFLAQVRQSIRVVLSKSRTKGHGLFGNASMNSAEEVVYHFIADNYENVYMDWEGSVQRIELKKLGYDLGSLEPIIQHCYEQF